jgi:hypothetical protein
MHACLLCCELNAPFGTRTYLTPDTTNSAIFQPSFKPQEGLTELCISICNQLGEVASAHVACCSNPPHPRPYHTPCRPARATAAAASSAARFTLRQPLLRPISRQSLRCYSLFNLFGGGKETGAAAAGTMGNSSSQPKGWTPRTGEAPNRPNHSSCVGMLGTGQAAASSRGPHSAT